MTLFDVDLHEFNKKNSFYSYRFLGAHLHRINGEDGVRFSVWAPRAVSVSVIGDFNHWNGTEGRMHRIDRCGIWALFVPGVHIGERYKYEIITEEQDVLHKADPYAFASEVRPHTASIVTDLDSYEWGDDAWRKNKQTINLYHEPLLIYELHLGSWRKKENGQFLTYKELASELIPYVKERKFTHIEVMPLTEHPYDRSWGYQSTGYFSVTSRYGTAEDFMYFVDKCHQHDIGVILDWVPTHFCKDAHGLRRFDGKPLYEYEDERKSEKPSWGTLTFDYSKQEVRNFLISNAFFWLDKFHIDGFRIDAVSSILYLNFDNPSSEKLFNQYGGEENLEAIQFLRNLNEAVFEKFPNTYMIAEESSAWPLVSAPTYMGGLGFNYKWNMGWMNDMLKYMEMDPIYRKWHHQLITFSFFYAFSENFILPISHDEVVHGKKSLLNKMPGDYWQKFANFRLFLSYMFAHPGKKLLFMGYEFAQFDEWKDQEELDWLLLDFELHRKSNVFTKALNAFYREEQALWQYDHDERGFEWIDPHDYEQSMITFMRKSEREDDFIIIVCNFTPVVRYDHYIGVPVAGTYYEVFNSDAVEFGGSGQCMEEDLFSETVKWHNQPYRIRIKVPPLAVLFLKLRKNKRKAIANEKK